MTAKFSWFSAALAATFGGVMIVTAAVSAQEKVPEDMLLLDYANCMKGCLDVEGRTGCEILCGCTMSTFRSKLDLKSYTALLDQLNENEISPENRAFLDQTAQECVAEMDKIMATLPPDAPADPSQLPPPEDTDDGDGGGN